MAVRIMKIQVTRSRQRRYSGSCYDQDPQTFLFTLRYIRLICSCRAACLNCFKFAAHRKAGKQEAKKAIM